MVATPLLLGLLLALGSGAAWTGLDAIRKHLTGALSPLAILLGLVIAQIPLHGAAVAVTGWPGVDAPFFAWCGVSALNAIAANWLLVEAFRRSPLSLTTPFLSFTPVATVATGALLLGQRPGPWGVAGVAVVVLGALLLDASPRQLLTAPLHAVREPGSRMALGVALLFALGNAVDRRAILHASEPLYALTVSAMVAALLLPLGAVRRELVAARGSHRWIAASGGVMAAAMLLQFFSYRLLLVAYVDAIKRAGANVLSIVFGRAFFAEAVSVRRLLAAGLMSAGVALVLWS